MRIQSIIKVNGIVQGVGFRPFCYRVATKLGLTGYVLNTGDAGVRIKLEGEKKSIHYFLDKLKKNAPPLAEIKKIDIKWSTPSGEFNEFNIIESEDSDNKATSIIPPDVGLCIDCLRELSDKKNRYYRYPFISCVNCGPRFTIIKEFPYDRQRTTMTDFPLCKECMNEYENPLNRRYHAESTACPKCGPEITLYRYDGERIIVSNPLKRAAQLLDEGKILAIKGLGGFHISTKTTSDGVIKNLRNRLDRSQKPLAIMSKNIGKVKSFAEISKLEEKVLTSPNRPIMILRKKDDFPLSKLISPNLDSIGVMLPYSGIHHILMEYGKDPAYIMTSGNLPGIPMTIRNSEAESKLDELVDYFIFHDRKIENRCDDSVMKNIDNTPIFLRRSRGFVPRPIEINELENKVKILGLGPESDVTTSLLVDDQIFTSQYIGDVDKLETLDYLENTSKKLLEFLNIDELDYIVHDLHPDYLTTKLAKDLTIDLNAESIPIQHHHAHIYSLMADQKIDEIIGIAADGAGYGLDGSIWGGEVFISKRNEFKKVGGLSKQPMPGGDQAAKYPSRMIAGILWNEIDSDEIRRLLLRYCKDFLINEGEVDIIIRQLERNINVPKTSSFGRVLDAISCLLGICGNRTYEGEPAIKLESFSMLGSSNKLNLDIKIEEKDDLLILDTSDLLIKIIDALKNGVQRKHIAAASQKALAEGLSEIAVKVANSSGINVIGVSGGVFYNNAINIWMKKKINGLGLELVKHKRTPPGDGGISIGQVYGVAKTI